MATDKRRRIHKLKDKYRLVIMNDNTLAERWSFHLTPLNVFITMGLLAIVLVASTIVLVALTPLREYIPGYMDTALPKKVYELQLRADSLDHALQIRDRYLTNVRNILSGRELEDTARLEKIPQVDYTAVNLVHSEQDSVLRAEFENRELYDLNFANFGASYRQGTSIANYSFFSPIKGVVSSRFNMVEHHFGVDVVARKNEAIKATLDGTVVFAGWTLETGYVIAIQHQRDILSVYKHNAALLKKPGNFVRAGDPIGIIGNTGSLSTGPHLHFELWYKGNPVNPEEFMTF